MIKRLWTNIRSRVRDPKSLVEPLLIVLVFALCYIGIAVEDYSTSMALTLIAGVGVGIFLPRIRKWGVFPFVITMIAIIGGAVSYGAHIPDELLRWQDAGHLIMSAVVLVPLLAGYLLSERYLIPRFVGKAHEWKHGEKGIPFIDQSEMVRHKTLAMTGDMPMVFFWLLMVSNSPWGVLFALSLIFFFGFSLFAPMYATSTRIFRYVCITSVIFVALLGVLVKFGWGLLLIPVMGLVYYLWHWMLVERYAPAVVAATEAEAREMRAAEYERHKEEIRRRVAERRREKESS